MTDETIARIEKQIEEDLKVADAAANEIIGHIRSTWGNNLILARMYLHLRAEVLASKEPTA